MKLKQIFTSGKNFFKKKINTKPYKKKSTKGLPYNFGAMSNASGEGGEGGGDGGGGE